VNFENWHFRYVGVENAQYMAKHQLVLEEYIQLLKKAGK
jgi:serine-type D-ala-D-ala carboxypeptidase